MDKILDFFLESFQKKIFTGNYFSWLSGNFIVLIRLHIDLDINSTYRIMLSQKQINFQNRRAVKNHHNSSASFKQSDSRKMDEVYYL